VDVDAERDSRGTVREFFAQDGVVEVAAARPAHGLREAQPQVTELAEFGEEFDRIPLRRVAGGRDRRDLLRDELPKRSLQLSLRVGQVEIRLCHLSAP